jgi:hypothetical protein
MDRREFVRLTGSGMAAGGETLAPGGAQYAGNSASTSKVKLSRHSARRFRRHLSDGRVWVQQHLQQPASVKMDEVTLESPESARTRRSMASRSTWCQSR